MPNYYLVHFDRYFSEGHNNDSKLYRLKSKSVPTEVLS